MRLLTIAMLPLALAACQSKAEKEGASVAASGSGATRTYPATGFTGVDLRGSDDVDVKTGAAFAVSAEGDPKILDRLDFQVVGNILRVSRKQGGGWFDNDKGARIHIVMPRLVSASVSGSGNFTADRAEGEVEAAVSGSGNLTIVAVKASATELAIAGSGDINVTGTTDKLEVSIAGSGNIEAGALAASSAEISVAGSGNVKGMVKGDAEVSIVGSGDVELIGGAKCQISALGSGEARCS